MAFSLSDSMTRGGASAGAEQDSVNKENGSSEGNFWGNDVDNDFEVTWSGLSSSSFFIPSRLSLLVVGSPSTFIAIPFRCREGEYLIPSGVSTKPKDCAESIQYFFEAALLASSDFSF